MDTPKCRKFSIHRRYARADNDIIGTFIYTGGKLSLR